MVIRCLLLKSPISQETNNEGDSRVVEIKKGTGSHDEMEMSNMESRRSALIENRAFWNRALKFEDEQLDFNSSPLTIQPWFQLSKLQYLFATLGCTCVFVVDKGKLVGLITKEDFLKHKK